MGTDVVTRLTGEQLAGIALEAGALIMAVFDAGFHVFEKPDATPVTEADEAAETLILARLAQIVPDLPVLAEESFAAGRIPALGRCFACVDPLDGTQEFIARRSDFTVNIAIIENGAPVQGVVYAPALAALYVAESPSNGWSASALPGDPVPGADQRTPLAIRPAPARLTAVASRSNPSPATDAFLARFAVGETRTAGSSLKFCLVASGEADIYPRMGRTMEWDTAAGHVVVLAAGGRVLDTAGDPLTYGKVERGFDNPQFIVYGDVEPVR